MARTFVQSMQVPLVVAAVLSLSIALPTAQAPAGAGAGAGAGQGRAGGGGRGPQTPPLLMTSSAWEDGGVIPDKYTQAAGAMAVSPELKWTQVPPGTQSFALLLHDPEPVLNKGSKMDITHWLIWNIPPTSTGLQEAVAQGELADGSRQVASETDIWAGRACRAVSSLHIEYALDIKLDVLRTPQQAADIARRS